MELADYSDLDILKKLFKSYRLLQKLEEKGDSVATCIRMDLDSCLKEMSEEERDVVEKVWIDGWTFKDCRKEFGVGDATIDRRLNEALFKAREVLSENE